MAKAEYTLAQLPDPPFFHAGLEFSVPARGTWTIAHTPMLIPEAMEIFVCPEGCLRGVVLSAAEFGGLDRFAMVTIKEQDLYEGKLEQLFIDGVCDILDHKEILPPCAMLYTSCIHHFMAMDTNLVFKALRERYPQIDFIENSMNCTMRKSKLHFEEVTMRQLYAPLKNTKKNPKMVHVVGNYFPLDVDSELVQMFWQNGWDFQDLCGMESYEEYKGLAQASYAIVTMPVALECGKNLEKRLEQKLLYAPYTWDMDEIKANLQKIAQACHIPCIDFTRYEQMAHKALRQVQKKIKDTPIQIDYTATPRPLGLAKLLLEHGFHVRVVYMDTLLPGEQKALDWLKVYYPDLLIRATVDFRCRLWACDEAKQEKILAIGQKATYFSGTQYFVNMVANDGYYGFVGIRKLAKDLFDAYIYPKDAEAILSIKAKGCIV